MDISYLRAGITCLPFVGTPYYVANVAMTDKTDLQNIRCERVVLNNPIGAAENLRAFIKNSNVYSICHMSSCLSSAISLVALAALKVIALSTAYIYGSMYLGLIFIELYHVYEMNRMENQIPNPA